MSSKTTWNRVVLLVSLGLGVALVGCKDKAGGDKQKEADKAPVEKAPAKAEPAKPPAKVEPAVPAAAAEAEPVQAEGLPKGEEIMDRFAEAVGAKAALAKVTTRVVKGTMSMPKMGLEGGFTLYQAMPAKSYFVIELAGIGKVEQGFDGEVAWEKTQMMGTRILEGDERAEAIEQAMPDSERQWRKLYKEAVTVALEEVDGKPAYKVVITRNSGTRKTIWFEKESGLLVKTAFKMKSAMGEMPTVARILDYRDVDGLKIPFKNDGEMMGQQQVLALQSVEHNVKLPDNRFDLPEDVKAIVANAKKGAGAAVEQAPDSADKAAKKSPK